MVTNKPALSDMDFLDMQAAVGITKHIGGLSATDELLSLCHLKDADEVLYVGCGIGAGPAYIAKRYGCRVIGVDISEKMIEWSRQRARQEGVETRTEFRVADVLDLPFEADRFDAVISESVLLFVQDKARAIRECVRVTKPGGYVGINEGFWIKEPPGETVAQVQAAIGPYIPTLDDWQTLWTASGLQERVVRVYQADAGKEVKGRVRWIGWRWLLRAWGRGVRLYLTNPAVRQPIREMFNVPPETFQYVGYGLFAGKK